MTANTIALLFNGLALALAISLLILLLWQDPGSETNRYYSLFLFSVLIWASGSMLARAAAFVNAEQSSIQMGLRLLDLGFMGASISIYIYTAVITGVRGQWFRFAAVAGFALALMYQVLLLVSGTSRSFAISEGGTLEYDFETASVMVYSLFLGGTLVVLWRNRRRVRMYSLRLGITLFAFGQLIGLISPRLRNAGVAEITGTSAALIMSYAIVRQQIMTPLLGRATQLEAVRDVGLAISSRLHLSETLGTIATQAARMLQADGAAIFLLSRNELVLSAVHNMPEQYVGIRTPLGHGIVGTVAVERRGRRMDSYHIDWEGEADLPLAEKAFGSVVCSPLMFADEVVGVLLVVQGRRGRMFDREDVHLLELLGPQAAVAITNSRLFEAERGLSTDLVAAKNQLETVLSSTENPVVAVDRKFEIIFANRAAQLLLKDIGVSTHSKQVLDLIPGEYLPPSIRKALRDLRSRGVHIYEVSAKQQTFLCHVAELGYLNTRAEGWVVVLNDVSQLKELDRLKSQMIQMTSHDLKNPLQAAMSYLELLSEDGADIFSEDMEVYVNHIWAQLNRMYRIISGILDLERIQAGTPAHENCDLSAIASRAVTELKPQADSKAVKLEYECNVPLTEVLGDEQQLAQALTNLVENAIKFTPPQGTVRVACLERAGGVEICIEDTGIGIPQEEQARVFERFYRGKQQKLAHIHGSGLGLSLVKMIVDAHHGEITLNSTLGQGTRIQVFIPSAAS